MDEFFKTKYQKKVFYFVVFLLTLLFLLVKFYLLPFYFKYPIPTTKDILNSILDNLLATVLVTVATGTLIFWLTPPVMKKATMEVIEPIRIKHELKEARTNTKIYWYKGGCGRFTRTVTIPELAAEARASNQHRTIYIQILDVTNLQTCHGYAEYRRSLKSANKLHPWNLEKVQLELYATIIAVYSWKEQVPLLDISIALITSISLFRIDLSSKMVVITKEDKQEPGLKCDNDTFFYNSYLEELRLSFKQAKLLPSHVKGTIVSDLDTANIKDLLDKLGILDKNLTDSKIDMIINLLKKGENPYA
jgi:hypothetical protein